MTSRQVCCIMGHTSWKQSVRHGGPHRKWCLPGAIAKGQCLLVRQAVVDLLPTIPWHSTNIGLAMTSHLAVVVYVGSHVSHPGYVVCQVCYPPFEQQTALDVVTLVGQICEDKEFGFIQQVLVHPSLTKHINVNINVHLHFK